MQSFTLRQRIRYAFDNSMSRATIALIGWLALASAVLILIISIPVWAMNLAQTDSGEAPLTQVIWMSLMRTLDAGTMGGDTGSWPFLFAMLALASLAFVFATALDAVLLPVMRRRSSELKPELAAGLAFLDGARDRDSAVTPRLPPPRLAAILSAPCVSAPQTPGGLGERLKA